MRLLRLKPVTLQAVAHAALAALIAFGVVDLDGPQLAAVEGLFAAVGVVSAQLVTANVRLDPAVLEDAKASGWGPLTEGWPEDA